MFDVCVYGYVFPTLEAKDAEEAVRMACDEYASITGLRADAHAEGVVWKASYEYPYTWRGLGGDVVAHYTGAYTITNRDRKPLSLSLDFKDSFAFQEAMRECCDAEALRKLTQESTLYSTEVTIACDSPIYTRLVYTNWYGSEHILIAHKE